MDKEFFERLKKNPEHKKFIDTILQRNIEFREKHKEIIKDILIKQEIKKAGIMKLSLEVNSKK